MVARGRGGAGPQQAPGRRRRRAPKRTTLEGGSSRGAGASGLEQERGPVRVPASRLGQVDGRLRCGFEMHDEITARFHSATRAWSRGRVLQGWEDGLLDRPSSAAPTVGASAPERDERRHPVPVPPSLRPDPLHPSPFGRPPPIEHDGVRREAEPRSLQLGLASTARCPHREGSSASKPPRASNAVSANPEVAVGAAGRNPKNRALRHCGRLVTVEHQRAPPTTSRSASADAID